MHLCTDDCRTVERLLLRQGGQHDPRTHSEGKRKHVLRRSRLVLDERHRCVMVGSVSDDKHERRRNQGGLHETANNVVNVRPPSYSDIVSGERRMHRRRSGSLLHCENGGRSSQRVVPLLRSSFGHYPSHRFSLRVQPHWKGPVQVELLKRCDVDAT